MRLRCLRPHPVRARRERISGRYKPIWNIARLIPKPAADAITPGRRSIIEEHLIQ